MVTRTARAIALTLTVTATQAATAQLAPRGPEAQSPLRGLLARPARLLLLPAFGLSGGAARSGLDALVLWERAGGTHPSRVALEANAARLGGHTYTRSGIAARVGSGDQRTAGWLGAGAAAGSGYGPRRAFLVEIGGRAGTIGLELRSTWLQDDATRAQDSTPTLPGSALRPQGADRRYTDAEVSARRGFGPFTAQLFAGARFGDSGLPPPAHATSAPHETLDRWAWASLSLPVRGRASLDFSGGWQPERAEIAQRAGPFARLALRIDVHSRAVDPETMPEPMAGLTVQRMAGSRYRLRLPAAAQRVEIRSDLTNWRAAELRAVTGLPRTWEIVLTAAPGVYHANIRIDGGDWIVPPGLPSVPDGFGGSTGLLTLQ